MAENRESSREVILALDFLGSNVPKQLIIDALMDVGPLKRVVATLATRVPLELLQHQIDDKQKALVDVLAKCSQF